MLTRQRMIQDFLEFLPDNSNVLLPEIGNWDRKSTECHTVSHFILSNTAFSQARCQPIDMVPRTDCHSQGCSSHFLLATVWYVDKHNHFETLHQMEIFSVWNPSHLKTFQRQTTPKVSIFLNWLQNELEIEGLDSTPGLHMAAWDKINSALGEKTIFYFWEERYAYKIIILDQKKRTNKKCSIVLQK